MKWEQIPLGPLQTNCYLLINDLSECLIVDPGEEGEKLISIIKNKGLTPVAILLTHAHFDHIGAVDTVKKELNLPVYIHEKEKDWLSNPALNGSQFFMMGEIKASPAEQLLNKEGKLSIGPFIIDVLETPGHSPGSLSYYFADGGFVVAGDTLFQSSIGRTDLPFGDHDTLMKSIHHKLLVLPEETIVLPGHGPVTTIGAEMDSNPFLHGF